MYYELADSAASVPLQPIYQSFPQPQKHHEALLQELYTTYRYHVYLNC